MWAHSRSRTGERHRLIDHLIGTAELADRFAAPFGAGPVARLAGLWHDVGKYGCAWQAYLAAAEDGERAGRVGHKLYGAKVAADCGVTPAAMAIAGHHGGLPSRAQLAADLAELDPNVFAEVRAAAAAEGVELSADGQALMSPLLVSGGGRMELSFEFMTRLLFSCLVDADFLDTAAHFDSAPVRVAPPADWDQLSERFHQRLAGEISAGAAGPLGVLRAGIAQRCVEQAGSPPGFFRLAVPTGGGKTIAGMRFALEHARRHGLGRVIVAVPFTSITEQNAAVYRRLLDGDQPVVLEHHSAAAASVESWWAKLATENWDAPVVVTTTVQLFESLFSNRPSAVRKVHRLARSVIVLDEVQALPMRMLVPILDGLQRLVRNAGATVLLSSATQPEFWALPPMDGVDVHDLTEADLWQRPLLRRTRFVWRPEEISLDGLVTEIAAREQVLVIVNSRRDAARIARAAAGSIDSVFHLSTRMCQAHRRDVLEQVRARLQAGAPCRLVSTQLIEAGVDVDFPEVWRTHAPADSLLQAAGRCNREGRAAIPAPVTVFALNDAAGPTGWYRTATQRTVDRFAGGAADPADPSALGAYYRDVYTLFAIGSDPSKVQDSRLAIDFPETANRFRMIDQDAVEVVIADALPDGLPWAPPEVLEGVLATIRELRAGRPLTSPEALRALRPFTVAMPRHELRRQSGWVSSVADGAIHLWAGPYDLMLGAQPSLEPEDLIL